MPPFLNLFAAERSSRRINYIARLFGLFNEDVVIHWCDCDQSGFTYRGRPTLKRNGDTRGVTLDFLLEGKRGVEEGRIYVAEMKCWLASGNCRHLTLDNMDFAARFTKENRAFQVFLDFAREPEVFQVSVKGRPTSSSANGAILIWSAASNAGRESATQRGISHVLSIEEMLQQLRDWNCNAWKTRVAEYERWSQQLFEFLR